MVGKAIGGLTLKQCQTCLDVDVGGIEISSPGVCIECIACLVVARLVKRAKVVPDLRDVGVESDGARVCIKRIAVLVDLVVKNTNRTPECRVATVAVYSLLIGLISLGVLLLRHVASAKKVPALSIILVW